MSPGAAPRQDHVPTQQPHARIQSYSHSTGTDLSVLLLQGLGESECGQLASQPVVEKLNVLPQLSQN